MPLWEYFYVTVGDSLSSHIIVYYIPIIAIMPMRYGISFQLEYNIGNFMRILD